MKLLPVLLISLLASSAFAQVSTSGFLQSIPPSSLRDPLGNMHSSTGRLPGPVVVIFSVPSMAQGGNQKSWAKALGADPQTKLSPSIGFYLVENMAQAGFSSLARDEMKKKYHIGDRPVLLLDETGDDSKRFGIPRNTTCVLLYSRANKLVHAEKGPATSASIARLQQAIRQLPQ